MNERDELLAQLRELRAQAEDLTERTSKIIAEEERRRHRWTPVVIRGGIAGAAVAWLAGLLRGAHPIAAATTTIGASGAIVGAVLAPPTFTPPQAEHTRPPAVERTAPAPLAPMPPAVEPTPPPAATHRPARVTKPAPRPPGKRARAPHPTPTPAQPTATPPPQRAPDPPSGAPDKTCVVDLDALDLVDLCLAPTATRAAPPG